ncbi:MAG: NAD(P)H-hydrate dehydratase [Pseudomonadota bacterium]
MTSPLYDSAGMRALDAAGQALPEIAAGALMERAGAALLAEVRAQWPQQRRIGIVCGPGNNGGDGFVLARLAREAGYSVVLHAGPSRARPESDGKRARQRWQDEGGVLEPLEAFDPDRAQIWVDCLFGIGLARPLTDVYGEVIERLNAAGQPVLAADVPSGVDVDSGCLTGAAVRATRTLTMIADKLGLRTGAGVDCAGTVRVADLGLPERIAAGVRPVARRLGPSGWPAWLPPRRAAAHKGDFGHVLVVGGAPGTSGAARLAGAAALRAGAGRVTLATHPQHAAWANLDQPELMVHGVESVAGLLPLLQAADAVVVGPGLGQEAWGRALWPAVADAAAALVVDADALNLLAQAPRQRRDWILTPHPGEAGRLLQQTVTEVEADRPASVRALAARFGGVALLKGAGTLVASVPEEALLCVTDGHPGMATAGSGDVLSGIIAALCAQGLAPAAAAGAGAAWHCAAARRACAVIGGERGMIAGDLVAALPAAAGEDAS